MITLPQLLDNAKCVETIRVLRWPDKFSCPIAAQKTLSSRARMILNLNAKAIVAKSVSANSTIGGVGR
jgi:hypothetical protein